MSLTNKANIKIGNIEYTPKSLKVGFESLQGPDSGRTDDGVMHIYWVRRKVMKLEVQMPPMEVTTMSTLMSAVQGQEYSLTFYDPSTNSERTISVYTSNSSTDWYSGVIKNGLVQGLSFNAIEL